MGLVLAARIAPAVIALLLLVGCGSSQPWEQEPPARVIDIEIIEAVRGPDGVMAIVRVTSPEDFENMNIGLDSFDRVEEPGRVQYGNGDEQSVGIPEGESLHTILVLHDQPAVPVGKQPVFVAAGVYGPFRQDGSYDDLVSDFPFRRAG